MRTTAPIALIALLALAGCDISPPDSSAVAPTISLTALLASAFVTQDDVLFRGNTSDNNAITRVTFRDDFHRLGHVARSRCQWKWLLLRIQLWPPWQPIYDGFLHADGSRHAARDELRLHCCGRSKHVLTLHDRQCVWLGARSGHDG